MDKITEALKLAEEALNAMLTHMGMDEDEWTKPTFNQAREALAAIRAARAQEDKVCGFSLLLDRESWGHILDGLMLERERSEQRKSANPESNSNYIADRCAELITQIGEAACLAPKASVPEFTAEQKDRFAKAFDAAFAKAGLPQKQPEKTNTQLYHGTATPAQPVKQRPVAWRVHPFDYGVGHEGAYAMTMRLEQVEAWNRKGWIVESLYATPVDAKAIRADALEEAAEWCEAKQSYSAMHANTEFAAGIRGLK